MHIEVYELHTTIVELYTTIYTHHGTVLHIPHNIIDTLAQTTMFTIIARHRDIHIGLYTSKGSTTEASNITI